MHRPETRAGLWSGVDGRRLPIATPHLVQTPVIPEFITFWTSSCWFKRNGECVGRDSIAGVVPGLLLGAGKPM